MGAGAIGEAKNHGTRTNGLRHIWGLGECGPQHIGTIEVLSN